MTRFRHFAAWRSIGGALTLVVAVWIVVHAAQVASQTEGGWQMLCDHLTAGIPGLLHPADYRDDQPTLREAKWLLAQGQQVLADSHATAADCMGAAQVLASIYGWREVPNPLSLGTAMWWPLRHPAVDLGSHTDLNAQLIQQSRRLAERTTQLEPKNVDWWRLRVLCCCGRWYNDPGSDEPLLREAASHDPDNALYGYLLAASCFDRAWSANSEGDLFIAHPEALFDSMNFYLQAMAKPVLATGEPGSACVARFFQQAKGRLALKLGCYDPNNFDHARSMLISRIESPLDGAKLDEFRMGRLQHPAASWFLSQNFTLDWLKQWRQSDESPGEAMVQHLSILASNLVKLLPDEREQITGFSFWNNKQFQVREREELSKVSSVVGVAASSAACMLLLVGWLAGLISRFRSKIVRFDQRDSKSPGLGVLLPTLIWLAIFAGTYCLLGLIPTFQPRLADCHWTVWGTIAAVLIALAIGALWVSLRFIWAQSRLPRQQRAPHYQFVRWGLVLAVSMVFVVVMQSLVDRHIRRWAISMLFEFPAHVVGEVENIRLPPDSMAWLSAQVGVANKTLPWSLVQWGIHGGLWCTTAGWLLAMFLLLWRRNEKLAAAARAKSLIPPESAEASVISSSASSSWQTYWRPIGKSALALALIFLIVSIAATTDWLSRMNQQYELKIARLANAKWLAEEIDASTKAQAAALDLTSEK